MMLVWHQWCACVIKAGSQIQDRVSCTWKRKRYKYFIKWYVQSVISSETDDAPTNSTNTEIGDAPTNLSEYTSKILQQTNPPTQSDLMASFFLLDI